MPTMPLPPLPPPDLSSEVATQIDDLIRDRQLRPGDRLPPVRSLARQLDVSPSTLREALRRLQATGMIELRHGSGTYVASGHERLMLANPELARRRASPEAVFQILDARLLIEPALAGMAATHATADEIATLEGLLVETERHLFPNDPHIGRITNAFHDSIARAAGNPVMAETDRVLLELYGTTYSAAFPHVRPKPRDLHDHIAILAAIRARDSVLANERMRLHLEASRLEVQERIGELSLDERREGEKSSSREEDRLLLAES